MNAAILAVGSELLTPERVDTNSLYLTARLNELGIEVIFKAVVGDDRARLAGMIRYALEGAEVVLLTGGLGPTEDDVTRDAVAEAAGRAQEFRQDIADAIEARFARMGRQMAEINRRQAFVIGGAEPLPNPNGTAPGQWLPHDGRWIALLPGPPRELKPMFEAEVLPRLRPLVPPLVIRTRLYRVACMPESDLDQLISPVYTKYENPATTVLAAPGDIQVHLRARCAQAVEAERLLAEVGGPIEGLLGDRIYSTNGDPLEAAVGGMLRRRGLTLAVAESATGGMLAERITSAPGSSSYFVGGYLAYSYAAKRTLLGVPGELLDKHKAVSEPVAKAMAEGARERLGTSLAIAITGVAGPDQGGEEEPVGTVWIAVAGPGGTSARRLRFVGDRERVRAMAVVWALDLLRRRLLEAEPEPVEPAAG